MPKRRVLPPTVNRDGQIEFRNAYDRCLGCSYLGNGCDGPNTLAMSLERWCQWCRDLKEMRGLTNQQVSELSGISLTTVDRIMAIAPPKDIKRNTCADISRVLVGSFSKSPCPLAVEEERLYQDRPETVRELERLRSEAAELRATVDRLREAHEREVEAIRADAKVKIEFLREQIVRKDEIMMALAKLK